jgi:pimeloyl-ACP methyl ester carboxylesterase
MIPGACETGAVFDGLRSDLMSHSIVLELPGFGAPLPTDVTVTARVLVDAATAQIESRKLRRVHLVGHEWGCVIAARIACERPDLVASWVSDYVAPPGADGVDVGSALAGLARAKPLKARVATQGMRRAVRRGRLARITKNSGVWGSHAPEGTSPSGVYEETLRWL